MTRRLLLVFAAVSPAAPDEGTLAKTLLWEGDRDGVPVNVWGGTT